MSRRLEYTTSVEMVRSALTKTSGPRSFSVDTVLGDLLGEQSQREVFRERLRDTVRAAGYGVRWKRIPVEPHITIHLLATTLTGLAGDPDVDDD